MNLGTSDAALRDEHASTSMRRTIACAAAGAATLALAVEADARWFIATLSAWDAIAGVFLGWVCLTVMRLDAASTSRPTSCISAVLAMDRC